MSDLDFLSAEQIFQSSSCSGVIFDEGGIVVAANDSAGILFGRPPQQIKGMNIADLIRDPQTVMNALKTLRESGDSVSFDAVVITHADNVDASVNARIDQLSGGAPRILRRIQFQRRRPTDSEQNAALRLLKNDLAHLNDVLRERNDDLERFAFAAAHDLQEPLRKIALLLDLHLRGFEDAPPEDLIKVREAARRARAMVSGLLRHASVSSAGLETERVELESLIADAFRHEAGAGEGGETIDIAALPAVMGDRTMIAQLFANLLSNAVKYQGTEPLHVRIAQRSGEDELVITVSDNGRGVDPALVEDIFKPFVRGRRKSETGVGLGLSLCRMIVSRHGGRIWAEAPEEGGARFCVALPQRIVVAEPQTAKAS